MEITTVHDKRVKIALATADNGKTIKGWTLRETQTVRSQLSAMLVATNPLQLNTVTAWHHHELKPGRPNVWSLRVTPNYRLTYRYAAEENTASELNYEDYH